MRGLDRQNVNELMHFEAYDYVKHTLTRLPPRKVVLEYGGRIINGTVKTLFVDAEDYTCIDLYPGPGVDKIADARAYIPEVIPDTVVCCEVLEHSEGWPDIVKAAGRILDPDSGVLILTCATPPRAPHSTLDGLAVRPFEYYGNVEILELTNVLDQAGFKEYDVDVLEDRGDLRVLAWRKVQA